MFWVAVSVLQLDEFSLYASGLALLEQNLHTLISQGSFEDKVFFFIGIGRGGGGGGGGGETRIKIIDKIKFFRVWNTS